MLGGDTVDDLRLLRGDPVINAITVFWRRFRFSKREFHEVFGREDKVMEIWWML